MKTEKRFYMRILLTLLTIIALFPISAHAQAQKEPKPPKSLADMVAKGSQVFYLGQFEGMNGWALIRQGKPEFFYENKDRTAMVMGLMFNDSGEMITMAQLKTLNDRVGDDMYAATGGALSQDIQTQTNAQKFSEPVVNVTPPQQLNRPLTKAEQMYTDLLAANWITINPDGAYDVFTFIDPDCPHCKQFLRDADSYLTTGGLRLRVIPIGVRDESLRKAALLLASANPGEKLKQYAAGDQNTLNAPESINTKAVESNLAMMLKHGFDVTPIIVYRTGKQEIRMIRGRPASIDMIINDIKDN